MCWKLCSIVKGCKFWYHRPMADHRYHFFAKDGDIIGNNQWCVPEHKRHHLFNVLKLSPSHVITLTTQTLKRTVSITHIQEHHVFFTVGKAQPLSASNPAILLIQALPKQDKFTDIIRSCTEIGVCDFVPLGTQKSLQSVSPTKQTRWETVLNSASEQSKQPYIPTLHPCIHLSELGVFLSDFCFDLCIVCWEDEHKQTLSQILPKKTSHTPDMPFRIAILIGPEGGLTRSEINQCRSLGFKSVSLGSHILRVETAGLYACAQIQALFAYNQLEQ